MQKKLFTILFVLGLIFIGFGDSFLPKPLSIWSQKTRAQINTVLIHGFNPKVKKPSQQREEQVENLEKTVGISDKKE